MVGIWGYGKMEMEKKECILRAVGRAQPKWKIFFPSLLAAPVCELPSRRQLFQHRLMPEFLDVVYM